jgi:hypothetical protein
MHTLNVINNINWNKSALSRFNAMINKSFATLLGLVLLSCFRWLFFIPINIPRKTRNLLLISYFRSDLLKDFHAIASHLSATYFKLEIKPYSVFKICNFSKDDIVYSWKESKCVLIHFKPKLNFPFLSQALLFFSLLEGIKLIKVLEKNNIKPNGVLSLMEMQFF